VKVMGQRNSLSPLDIKQANILYNCKGKHNDSSRVANAVWAIDLEVFTLPNFMLVYHINSVHAFPSTGV
jgi:hypothetical protein